MTKQQQNPAHLPQLDGLRALALAFVFFWHFYKIEALPGKWATIPYGEIGVRLFFVLSGFLITGILLRVRTAGKNNFKEKIHLIRQFYMRRFLRIFPLYYLVILGALLIFPQVTRGILVWLLTYTTNFLLVLRGEDAAGWFAHFWSLAIEEQFYLFWPWIMVFAPTEGLLPIILAMVGTGPLYRWYVASHHFSPEAVLLLTPTTFDALGLGALLAWLWHHKLYGPKTEQRIFPAVVGLSMLGLVFLAVMGRGVLFDVWFYFFVGLISFCLVGRAANGYPDKLGQLMASNPPTYIGKISYGLYVYHMFFVPLLIVVFNKVGWWAYIRGLRFLAIGSLASLAVASLSWFAIERPINKLKSRFTY